MEKKLNKKGRGPETHIRCSRKVERERIGCGAEMPSCEREPSVQFGRVKGKKRLAVLSH